MGDFEKAFLHLHKQGKITPEIREAVEKRIESGEISGQEAQAITHLLNTKPVFDNPVGDRSKGAKFEKWGLRQRIGNAMRPVANVLGGTLGAVIGAPLAPESAGISSVAGAGLGYGMSNQIVDLIEGRDRGFFGAVKDVSDGAVMEMGGQAIGPVVKAVAPKVKAAVRYPYSVVKKTVSELTKNGMQKKAGQLLIARTGKGEIIAKNVKEAVDLERKIPGLKFSLGQRSSDPALIKLERAQVRAQGTAANFNAEQIAQNNTAIRDFHNKAIKGNPEDFTKSVRVHDDGLDVLQKDAVKKAWKSQDKIIPGDPQNTGHKIIEAINNEKGPVESAMGKLEAGIPDYPMSLDQTKKVIKTALTDKKLSLQQRKAVKAFKNDLDELLEQGETTHTVFGINRTLNDSINKAYAGGADSTAAILLKIKNEGVAADLESISKLARSGRIIQYKGSVVNTDRLAAELEEKLKRIALIENTSRPDLKVIEAELKSVKIPTMRQKGEDVEQHINRLVNDYQTYFKKPVPVDIESGVSDLNRLTSRVDEIRGILGEASPGQDVGSAMKAYNDYASSEYFGRFGRGQVKRVTSRELSVQTEHVASNFKTPSGADDLIKAMGSREKAAKLIRENLNHDLLTNAVNKNGEITSERLARWLKKNRVILNKYGLKNDYIDVAKATSEADTAIASYDAFQKTSAAKVLNADPDKIFSALTGGADMGVKARQMYDVVRNDKNAVAGLQKAFSDHLLSISQRAVKDIADNPIISPAKLDRVWSKYATAIREIYKDSPEKIKALMTMKKAISIMTRNTYSPAGGGSDTAENLANQLFAAISPKTTTIKFISSFLKPLKERSEREINGYINRALFDPEYAQTLIDGATIKIPPKFFKKKIDAQMKRIGRVSTMAMEAASSFDDEANDKGE